MAMRDVIEASAPRPSSGDATPCPRWTNPRKLEKAQRHNGKPCSVDLTVYHGDRHFVVRVVEPDRLPEDDE